MITGIAHVCFRVADLERSISFYVDQLGLTPAFEFRRDDGTKFGQYIHAGGRNFIELFVGEIEPPSKGQSYGHICLEVDDMEATVAALRERGVEVTDIVVGSDHSAHAWLADPDGNRIELHAYNPQSKQTPYLK